MSDNNIHQFRSSRSPKHPAANSPADPYTLVDGMEYDIDKYYVGSRDRDGESMAVTVPVPRSFMAQIDAIIQQRSIPAYRTRQDLIRDALHHRMHHLKGVLKDPQLERSLHTILARGELERRMTEMQDREDLLRELDEALTTALKAGDLLSLREILSKTEGVLEEWPACGARDRLAALIDRYRRMG